jgi:chlorophyll/bacteriochlorophyll a synthase
MSDITPPRIAVTSVASAPFSALRRSFALMKPVTWFAPAWAFLCGGIASNSLHADLSGLGRLGLGILLAGPVLCGLSQVVNDYCDREVDAINQPERLIPSGQVSIPQVFTTIGVLTAVGLLLGLALGQEVALLTAVGLLLAVIYSAHPVRAKRNGWVGNTLVAVSYEGLPWLAGHLAFGGLTTQSVIIAACYSLGAHGIIPVLHGVRGAAWLALLTMNVAQLLVMAALASWGSWIACAVVGALLLAQLPIQRRFLSDPVRYAVFYNASGTTLFVWGMLAAAVGL